MYIHLNVCKQMTEAKFLLNISEEISFLNEFEQICLHTCTAIVST